jgi:hypothetical protein
VSEKSASSRTGGAWSRRGSHLLLLRTNDSSVSDSSSGSLFQTVEDRREMEDTLGIDDFNIILRAYA